VKGVKPVHRPNRKENFFGWLSTGCVFLAYNLNVAGYITAQSLLYLLLNTLGSVGILYIGYRYRNYQQVLLNVFWVGTGLVALYKLYS
jgi:hypothetical protein